MHSRKPTCTLSHAHTFRTPSKSQRENLTLPITCYSRWNLAYTGVEETFTSSDRNSGPLPWRKSSNTCGLTRLHWLAWCALVLLVPRACDPVPLAGRERGHSWLLLTWADTRSHRSRWGPAASAQRRRLFPGSNRIPTFVILSGVFTPILPKPIEKRANSAATDLK